MDPLLRDFSAPALAMGLLTGFVGFASSFPVVLQGLSAVGATQSQAASGLMALCLTMGLGGILLSWRHRMPISMAWSTPGAALLVTTGAVTGGFAAAVGAFIVCAGLIVATGLWRPFGRAVGAIPGPLANAMLAGILMGLCLAPVKAVAFDPWLGLPIVLAWLLVGRFNRLLAVPAALIAFVAVMLFAVDLPAQSMTTVSEQLVPALEWVWPTFNAAAIMGIAIPLFVVTMASQNIPGMAVLKANHYEPAPGPLFTTSGVLSAAGAPFGGHAVNLAALTAALCAGDDAHPQPNRRYWAAVVAGVVYIAFGCLAGVTTAFVSLAPSVLIEAVAGLALLGAFSTSALAAFGDPRMREAAAVTFLVTASGISFFGVAGAFWGLLAGGLMVYLAPHR